MTKRSSQNSNALPALMYQTLFCPCVPMTMTIKIVLVPKAVTLDWPLLLGRWSSVGSYINMHRKDSDCFARLAPHIVALF